MKPIDSFGRKGSGYSLLEIVVAVSILFTVASLTVPTLMTQVYFLRLQYSAIDLSGLLQSTRMEAVRKNSFCSVQPVAGNPGIEQVVDRNGNRISSIAPAQINNSVTLRFGPGSGAPGESAFIASLGFAPAATGGLPSFNARGLPCIPAAQICSPVPGQGFVFFLALTGPVGTPRWAAVAVTPSGRSEVWAFDGSNWSQR